MRKRLEQAVKWLKECSASSMLLGAVFATIANLIACAIIPGYATVTTIITVLTFVATLMSTQPEDMKTVEAIHAGTYATS